MKKILLLVPSLGIGGQEKIAINTANCLKNKYDVNFVVFQKKEIEYEYPCEVININVPAQKGKFAKLRNQFKRIIKIARLRKKLKSDYVISFGETANITNVLSGMLSKGKNISAIHSFAGVKKSVVNKLILKCSHSVICIAKAMQDKLLSVYPKAKNTVVVENGYNIEQIITKANEGPEVDISHPFIVAMGRLEKVKGFDRLIEAFARAREKCEELKLAILGEGSLRGDLELLAKNEGVDDSVLFMGHQKNPYVFLKAADLLVMSSRNEGFPNTLIEALACECPIVSVDCQSGPREILSKQYTSAPVQGLLAEEYGVLVENAESEEKIIALLSEAILLMIEDEDKRNKYRKNGVARANQFNDDVYEKKIINIFESVR